MEISHSNLNISREDGVERLRLPIYYLEVNLSYFKRKSWIKAEHWIVTFVDDVNEILKQDYKTRSYLEKKFYTPKYKGTRSIRIDEVKSKIRIGETNW